MKAPRDSQWAAIRDADRHALVVAGAGTGKTYTVVQRVLFMLGVPVRGERYAHPVELDEIAAITFTNQAARELREDLRTALRAAGRRADAYRVDEARIGTIHGFCTEILREHALRRGMPPATRALEEGEAVARATQAARDALIDALEDGKLIGLPELLGMWETSKVDRWVAMLMGRPDLIRRLASDSTGLDPRETALVSLAGLALRKHERRLIAEGVIDYDRMILWTRDLVVNDPLVRASLQRSLRLLIIDEFQDVDPVQKEIAYAIGDPAGGAATPRLMLVGDPKQSIYRFRRADVSVWNEVRREFEKTQGCAVHTLQENFRSRPAILGFVDATVGAWLDRPGSGDAHEDYEVAYQAVTPTRDDDPDCPVELIVTPAAGEGESVAIAEVRRAEAQAIAARALELRQQGAAWRDMALLIPAWADEPIYSAALREAGVPVYVIRDERFYEQREIVDLILALRAVRDPRDDVALFGFLRGPFVGLRDESLLAIARNGRVPYWPSLGKVELEDDAEADRLARARQLLARCSELRDRIHPADLLDFMFRETGFLAHLVLRGDDGRQAIANVRRFLAMTRDLDRTGLGDVLRTIREARERDDRVAQARLFGAGENVFLITSIHVAKGLEWPIVFWANLSAGKAGENEELLLGRDTLRLGTPERAVNEAEDWKNLRERLASEAGAERKRLWYVAATRAMNRLIVSGIACGKAKDSPGADLIELLPDIAQPDATQFSYSSRDGRAYRGIIRHAPQIGPREMAEGAPADADGEDVALRGDPGDTRSELVAVPAGSWPGEAAEESSQGARSLVVAREQDRSPVGPPRHSATEFMLHVRCPRRHWFRYTLGIREPELGGKKEELVSAAARGLIVHDVLERYEADLELDALLEDAIGRWDEHAPTPGSDRGMRYRKHLSEEVQSVLEHPDYARIANRPGSRRELDFLRIRPDGTAVLGTIDLASLNDASDGLDLLDVKTTQCDAAAARKKAEQYAPQRDAYVAAASAISGMPATGFAFQFSRAKEHIAWNVSAADVRDANDRVDGWIDSIEKGTSDVTAYPAECRFCGYRRAGLCPGAAASAAGGQRARLEATVPAGAAEGRENAPDAESGDQVRTMPDLGALLNRLGRDRFRSSFHLGRKEREALERKGLDAILDDARTFIDQRLAPAAPVNDGAQTPWRGHPAFIAQHATATCCRSCLQRWHAIDKGRALDPIERAHIIAVIAAWLDRAAATAGTVVDTTAPSSQEQKRKKSSAQLDLL